MASPWTFFKASLDIIKEDLMKVIKEFEVTGNLDWRLNVTSLKLIPKTSGAVSFHNFRPISLIGGVYKIVSKLLAERLKTVLPYIISDYQGAFIHDRQINDGIIIAAEVIDSRIRANKSGIVCKVDFEKAFDNVKWNFIDFAMERFGFGIRWRNWIKWCISFPRFSILINGEATSCFKSQKGIRQGDPISPFLFIMVVEILSLMIKKTPAGGLITGFQVAKNGTVINHLQFADDLVVFLDDCEEEFLNLKNILFAFELVAGLKVNFLKGAIFGIGDSHNGANCASTFGCQLTTFSH